MSLGQFHPATMQWFAETLGSPTAAQRRGWAAIGARHHTLIAAPTGSGKTLAAFLTALDELLQEGLRSPLPDEVRVVYVSPLKALSADIHKNLSEPRRPIPVVLWYGNRVYALGHHLFQACAYRDPGFGVAA